MIPRWKHLAISNTMVEFISQKDIIKVSFSFEHKKKSSVFPHFAQRSSSVSQGAATNAQALAHHGALDPARAWSVHTAQRSLVRDHSGRSVLRAQTHSQPASVERGSFPRLASRECHVGRKQSQPGHPRERPCEHESPSDSGSSAPQPERRRSRAAASQTPCRHCLRTVPL